MEWNPEKEKPAGFTPIPEGEQMFMVVDCALGRSKKTNKAMLTMEFEWITPTSKGNAPKRRLKFQCFLIETAEDRQKLSRLIFAIDPKPPKFDLYANGADGKPMFLEKFGFAPFKAKVQHNHEEYQGETRIKENLGWYTECTKEDVARLVAAYGEAGIPNDGSPSGPGDDNGPSPLSDPGGFSDDEIPF